MDKKLIERMTLEELLNYLWEKKRIHFSLAHDATKEDVLNALKTIEKLKR